MTCEDRDIGCDFPGLRDVRSAALASVFAFRVLADDNPVEISGVVEWGCDAAEDARRADVGVLLERLADGEAEAPEGDMIGDVYNELSVVGRRL